MINVCSLMSLADQMLEYIQLMHEKVSTFSNLFYSTLLISLLSLGLFVVLVAVAIQTKGYIPFVFVTGNASLATLLQTGSYEMRS